MLQISELLASFQYNVRKIKTAVEALQDVSSSVKWLKKSESLKVAQSKAAPAWQNSSWCE